MDDLTNYRQLYIKTAWEYTEKIAEKLSILELNPHNKEAVTEVHRLSHSLKGSSIAMRYSNTASLCGIFEDIFKKIMEEELEASEELIQIMKDSLKSLRSNINSIESDNKESELGADLRKLRMIGKLEKVIEY